MQVSVKTFAQAVGKARKELTYSAEKRCELCNWCWRWHLAEEVTDRKVTDSRRPSKWKQLRFYSVEKGESEEGCSLTIFNQFKIICVKTVKAMLQLTSFHMQKTATEPSDSSWMKACRATTSARYLTPQRGYDSSSMHLQPLHSRPKVNTTCGASTHAQNFSHLQSNTRPLHTVLL